MLNALYEGGGILTALGVANIFREVEKRSVSIEFASELRARSKQYEHMAVEILNKAY